MLLPLPSEVKFCVFIPTEINRTALLRDIERALATCEDVKGNGKSSFKRVRLGVRVVVCLGAERIVICKGFEASKIIEGFKNYQVSACHKNYF